MISNLSRIQPTVIDYLSVISQILKIDVEIMDENFVRIAGTGPYAEHINESMEKESNVYKRVLETGQNQIIARPKGHILCKSCPKRDTCIEKFELCTPIILKEKVIGVIGLLCFKDEQVDLLLSNMNAYNNFLKQLSELISAKAFEMIESEALTVKFKILDSVVENLEQGVIIVDDKWYITHVNKTACKILGIKNYLEKHVQLVATGSSFHGQDEYKLTLDNEDHLLVGVLQDMGLDERKYTRMFIFDEAKTLNYWVSKLTNPEDNITLNNIISNSDKINFLKKRVLQISNSSSTVLIIGESGTGKEMFARAIHNSSERKKAPFIAINCGAIPESLLESELFGYVRGAFTGADPKGRIGKFEMADKGTIFLDEIGDMPLYMQAKLLRTIQDKEITRVGSNDSIKVDVRIISATNRNLEEMMEEGQFRQDLYYRLNVIPMEIPPLRERKDDIKLLTMFFTKKYSELFNKTFKSIDKNVWNILYNYEWPGNIRELENTVEFMINTMDESGAIFRDSIPKRIINYEKENTLSIEVENGLNLKRVEKKLIIKALKIYGNTTNGKKKAASDLGIGIATLYRKLEEYELG